MYREQPEVALPESPHPLPNAAIAKLEAKETGSSKNGYSQDTPDASHAKESYTREMVDRRALDRVLVGPQSWARQH